MAIAPNHLFITGCPRSGTSALVNLLNTDERIIVGYERFQRTRQYIDPYSFTEPVFFNPASCETTLLLPDRYDRLRARWQSGTVRYIGDKTPLYFYNLARLGRVFPEAKFIFLFRELRAVASSFNVRARNPQDHWPETVDFRNAVVHWNESLRRLRRFMRAQTADRTLIVHYERFYAGEGEYLRRLYDFLELDLVSAVEDAFAVNAQRWASKDRNLVLDDAMIDYLETERDLGAEEWCLREVERQVPSTEAAG